MSYLNKLTCLAWVLHVVDTKAVGSYKMSAGGSRFCLLNGDCSLRPGVFTLRPPASLPARLPLLRGTAALGFARPALNWWEETWCKTQRKPIARVWGPGGSESCSHADAPTCSSASPRPLAPQQELKKHNPDSRKQRATLQN